MTCKTTICDGCHRQFLHQQHHRCIQCATILSKLTAQTAIRCGDCLKKPPAFDATIVAANYAPPIDQLVLALKFGNRLGLAPLFARMLCNIAKESPEITLPTRLIAVPLGPRRLVERGFNQALEIAKPLARTLHIDIDSRLAFRIQDTQAQAMLHPEDRQKNVRRAFIIPDNAQARVQGQHIGVVDDVITTGATLHELASTLKRFGASRVTNFVFARTPHN